jgi:hypothetical protein
VWSVVFFVSPSSGATVMTRRKLVRATASIAYLMSLTWLAVLLLAAVVIYLSSAGDEPHLHWLA